MNNVIRLRGFAAPKKVFMCYNFKQVRDAVLLLLYADRTRRHEKVFIYRNANRWETDVLRNYTNEAAYKAICRKLQTLSGVDTNDAEEQNDELNRHSRLWQPV
jgi:hypothetical protein